MRPKTKQNKKKTWSKISTFGEGCGYPLAQDSICQQFGVIGPPRPEEAREDYSQPASSCVLDSVGRKTIVRGNPLVCDCQWFMMLLCFKGEQWGTQSLSKNIMRFTLISKSLSPPHFRGCFFFFLLSSQASGAISIPLFQQNFSKELFINTATLLFPCFCSIWNLLHSSFCLFRSVYQGH